MTSSPNRTTVEWQALDAAHHLHPFSNHKSLRAEKSRVITRADGIYLWDSEGNRLLDGMSGLWCVNVGYGRKALATAAYEQMLELPYYNTFFKTATPASIELSKRLAEIAPPGFSNIFFGSSGSEANDTIIRMVRHFWQIKGQPQKRVIIGREYGYHGSTVAAGSAGGMVDMHKQGADMPDFVHVMPPYWYGYGGDMDPAEFGRYAAKKLEEKILELGADRVAAFIGEPIQGAGGVIIPPETYWPEVNRICKEHNILLIADEVICGFGRTGHWFGTNLFGIQPDLMTTAKGITSGYLPLSAVFVGDRVANVLVEEGGEFFHGYTYSGHPASCAVALANLDILQNEGLIDKVAAKGETLRAALRDALGDHPLVGEIRGHGLIGAIELVADRQRRSFFPEAEGVGMKCRNFCFSNNLVMRAVRDTMVFAPPFIITDDQIAEFVTLAARSIDQTARELRAAA